ncbi:hypothetical protein Bbelb_365380 [Branchiostoma belcheri]|nr:hypothetical protein Bbelb_365380 [Branchiostoma belcheri]
MRISDVTSDTDGNILLTNSYDSIKVYNSSLRNVFEFRAYRPGENPRSVPRGICFDTTGNILVANSRNGRVDMFTSRGTFVRTVVNITKPWGIAVGPAGQLVVTNGHDDTVTVFPRDISLL